jgi:hypothetical protein
VDEIFRQVTIYTYLSYVRNAAKSGFHFWTVLINTDSNELVVSSYLYNDSICTDILCCLLKKINIIWKTSRAFLQLFRTPVQINKHLVLHFLSNFALAKGISWHLALRQIIRTKSMLIHNPRSYKISRTCSQQFICRNYKIKPSFMESLYS